MDTAEILRRNKRIRRLTRLNDEDLTAPPPPPPPDPDPFLVGVNSTSPNLDRFNVNRAFAGYRQGGFASFPDASQYWICSIKPETAGETESYLDVTAEAWKAEGRNPADLRVAVWHEPYDNMDASKWGGYQEILRQLAAEHGFKPVSIFTAELRQEYFAQVPSTFEVWLDPYDWSEDGEGPWDLYDTSTWTGQKLEAALSTLKAADVPIGIAEFGTRHKPEQPGWINRNVTWMITEGMIGCCYFDRRHTEDTGKVNNWLLTAEGVEALKSFEQ